MLPCTDYLNWTAFKAFKSPVARLIKFNSSLNYQVLACSATRLGLALATGLAKSVVVS